MLTLWRKEINSFLYSLTGYIVIVVFLLVLSLFLWVLPTQMNVFDFGYASLDSFFHLSPFVFLFLIPAITMRMFSEEKKTGTMELLLTKPLSETQIILSKYLASIVLIIISLLPTLIYYISINRLASPVGNVDSGAYWGSFIGLILLGAVFAAIGIFTSSLTNNQIIAFIVAVFVCGFLYVGLDLIHSFSLFGSFDLFIRSLSLNYHYQSISRGMIDTRDLVYFLSMIILFVLFTKFSLDSRKW